MKKFTLNTSSSGSSNTHIISETAILNHNMIITKPLLLSPVDESYLLVSDSGDVQIFIDLIDTNTTQSSLVTYCNGSHPVYAGSLIESSDYETNLSPDISINNLLITK
jgi:hypothetical protein